MLEHMQTLCEHKRILILGLGREGRSTLNMLKRLHNIETIGIADKKEVTMAPEDMGAYSDRYRIICGEDYQNALDDYDIVFKSPGIVLERDISEYKCKITSEIQEFMEVYSKNIIGITGTKGKSTTTSLMYHILKHAGRRCVIGGNIGVPVFELVDEIDSHNVTCNDMDKLWIVLELSCHQLEYCTVSPHIAVLLNLYEEHLDHYGTYNKYIAAKENVYMHQGSNDDIYVKGEIETDYRRAKSKIHRVYQNQENEDNQEYKGKCAPDSEDVIINQHTVITNGEKYNIPVDDIKLIGEHNYFNLAICYAIAHKLGISNEQFNEALKDYEPLPHRLQYIGMYDGVAYYDDSISTIGETTIQAINSLKSVDTVLIGGMDRDINYNDLENFLNKSDVKNVVFMYSTGRRIYDEMASYGMNMSRFVLVDNLEEAVKVAKKCTAKGRIVVMSPAAASYGYFKNFEERGDRFAEYVRDNSRR